MLAVAGATGWGVSELRRLQLDELLEYAELVAVALRARLAGHALQYPPGQHACRHDAAPQQEVCGSGDEPNERDQKPERRSDAAVPDGPGHEAPEHAPRDNAEHEGSIAENF